CKRLIDRANEMGGPDNITVIAARFEGDALTAPEDGDAVGHRVFPLGGEDATTPPWGQLAVPLTRTSGRAPRISEEERTTLRVSGRNATTPSPEMLGIMPALRRSGSDLIQRRMRGSMIALALMVFGLALATWWVMSTVSSAVRARQQRPAATTTSP